MAEQGKKRMALFNTIDATTALLEDNTPLYEEALKEIVQILTFVLVEENNHQIIAFKTRLKAKASLKEKIIRRELYKEGLSPQDILKRIPDIIGVLVECRFNSDEVRIYTRLKEHFFLTTEDGLFYDPAIPGIYLDLAAPQPQNQKNGMGVFRIDGYFNRKDTAISFELQIKSKINSFWSEVEHELIYKNNAFIPHDDNIREVLNALKSNLDGIDTMLKTLSAQLNPQKETPLIFTDLGYGNFLAMLISDLYMKKMANSLGFTIDFRKTCEVLGFYVARKVSHLQEAELRQMLFRLSNSFVQAREKKTNFEEELVFTRDFAADNSFSQILGCRFQELANQDYEWHVFFKMLFEMEDGEAIDDLELFVLVLYKAFSNDELYIPLYESFSQEIADLIKEEILIIISETLAKYGRFKMLYQESLQGMLETVKWTSSFLAGEKDPLEAIGAKKEMIYRRFYKNLNNFPK